MHIITELSQYNFQIKYCQGKTNRATIALYASFKEANSRKKPSKLRIFKFSIIYIIFWSISVFQVLSFVQVWDFYIKYLFVRCIITSFTPATLVLGYAIWQTSHCRPLHGQYWEQQSLVIIAIFYKLQILKNDCRKAQRRLKRSWQGVSSSNLLYILKLFQI